MLGTTGPRFFTLPGTRGTRRQRRLLCTCICTALLSWISRVHLVPLSVTKRRPVHIILNPGHVEYELGVLTVFYLHRYTFNGSNSCLNCFEKGIYWTYTIRHEPCCAKRVSTMFKHVHTRRGCGTTPSGLSLYVFSCKHFDHCSIIWRNKSA